MGATVVTFAAFMFLAWFVYAMLFDRNDDLEMKGRENQRHIRQLEELADTEAGLLTRVVPAIDVPLPERTTR